MGSFTWISLVCLVVSCLAQRPRPCRSPPLLVGSLSVATQGGELFAYGKYTYDALGNRIRFGEIGSYKNQSFHLDVLMLFGEGIMYKIDYSNRTCEKVAMHSKFHPMEIPDNANLLGQVILGSSSAPGLGLLVNTWTGDVPKTQGKYMATFTEFGCLPVSVLYYSHKTGWITTSYFNIVLGIEDPGQFIPPPFCADAQLKETDGETVDYFSIFL